jgi:hypothetical protein
MGIFQQWKQRRLRESTPGLGLQTGTIDHELDGPIDYDKTKKELFDIVLTKYPDETMQFLEEISERGDEEVKNLFKKLKHEKGNGPPHHPGHPQRQSHEIVPPIPDVGHGMVPPE